MNLNSKICLFIPNLKVGGAERVAVTLANYFALSCQVDVVVLRDVGDLRGELNEKINLVSLNINSMKKELFGLKGMSLYLKRNKPDALLCFMWPLTIVGVLSRIFSRHKCTLVLSDHTTFSQTRWIKNRIKRFLFSASVRATYMKAEHRVMVSESACRDLEFLSGLPKGTVKTIYNPIIIPEKKASLNTLNSLCEKRKLITVGSLKWAKNHRLLLDAFELLYKDNSNISLTIVGAGELEEQLREIISSKQLNDAVTMTGQLLNEDLANEYLSSDLFVLTSHYEGFSMVIAEALSFGLPVVSVDCKYGPTEIINNDLLGVIVKNHDAKALCNSIKCTLDKKFEQDYLVNRAREFSVERIGEQYLNLLLDSKK